MTENVHLLTEAIDDLEEIYSIYMKMAGRQYAERITDKLIDTAETLGIFPYAGAIMPETELAKREYRRIVCENFVLVYKVIDKQVYIYRIVNGRTNYPELMK